MPPKKVSLPPNPPPDPSQNLPLAYTNFFSVAPVNAKNVSSSYLKTEAQTWISRAAQSAPITAQLGKGKKRKLAQDAAEGEESEPEDDEDEAEDGEEKPSGPAAKTIVIHPGSEYLRIGRATDLYPLTLPNAIARRPKLKKPVSAAATTNGDSGEGRGSATITEQANGEPKTEDVEMSEKAETEGDKGKEQTQEEAEEELADERDGDEERQGSESGSSDKRQANKQTADELDEGIEAIRNELRTIMRQEKLRPVGNGKALAANYNDGVQPEDVPEHNDMFGLQWTDEDAGGSNDVLVGQTALRLACFSEAKTPEPKQTRRQLADDAAVTPADTSRPWQLFQPFKRGGFNLSRYEAHYGGSAAVQALLGDVRQILEHAITSAPEDPESTGESVATGLGIAKEEISSHTAILILPDLFSRSDLRHLIELLLVDMGFAGACVQTEGVCATFGAGLSSACVVDLGAEHVGISCVEEGLVLPETRVTLRYGGRDVSRFLGELFHRARFPYHELDWEANQADAQLLDSLKEKLVTLNPSDVGLNIHDFYLRLPSRPTLKYLFRTYDELILGPMSLFDPRVFDFDENEATRIMAGDEDDENDSPSLVTAAMKASVKHLLPPEPVAAEPVAPVENGSNAVRGEGTEAATTAAPAPEGESSAPVPATAPAPAPVEEEPSVSIDIGFESSKIALDRAVFHSLQATAGEDRLRKMANNILCVGGTALIPGLGAALEARLNALFAGGENAPKVTVIPPPRDMDPRLLAWKGMSVFARLESANETWIRREDWDLFGYRALKEKTLFL